jgi:hypothetical protein
MKLLTPEELERLHMASNATKKSKLIYKNAKLESTLRKVLLSSGFAFILYMILYLTK